MPTATGRSTCFIGFAAVFLLSALAPMGHREALAGASNGSSWRPLRSSLYVLSLLRIVGGTLCYLGQIVGAVLLIAGEPEGITVGAIAVIATFVYLISGSWLLIMGTIQSTRDSRES